MATVADTSFVVAVALVTEEAHQACVTVYKRQGVIYLPQTTLAEVMYLIMREAGNAVAERRNITEILTLDNRDFRIVRPKHHTHFTILPDNQS